MKAEGANILRGGAFKPRSSPYAFRGIGVEGLRHLAAAGAETGMPVITELMSVTDIDAVCRYADDGESVAVLSEWSDRPHVFQPGTRWPLDGPSVVGQVLRYMGFVLQELAETGQTVRGVIVALEDDQKLRRALAAVPNISFYRYQVRFSLVKG